MNIRREDYVNEYCFISWNDILYPNLPDERMVVYESSFPDGTFYIGKTTSTLHDRFVGHSMYTNSTPHGLKIKEWGSAEVKILDYATSEEELDKLEKKRIHEAIQSLGIGLNEASSKLDLIHKKMLNEKLYL